ncbi:lipid A biosynthesis acyltransferase [Thermodesulfobium narugense DSM 14796]|uniref:Lipid A biosynthesis acyltransferase n=1 Tax=Thermodesulfobium narugense DSM 14796 TaxID=747365 RepID=M1E6W3_9BACT|nr:lysophospholipid acyltransferase family protein [Thermodesulfobium narugense]AEE14215.1 lipid A biosynthesis acyltransferase [Thermodesulfobium narugense DSM 14796]
MLFKEKIIIFLCYLILENIKLFAHPVSLLMKSFHKKGFRLAKLRFKNLYPNLSEKELNYLVSQNFYNYSIYYLEIILLPLLIKFIRYFINNFQESYSILKDCFIQANDRGIIVITAHFGNWDLGSYIISSISKECNKEAFAVVESIRPRWLFNFFKWTREKAGLKIIPLNESTGIKSLKELKNGNVIALVVDRNLTKHGIKTTFFGRECIFNDGPSILIKRTNPKLFVAGLYRLNKNYQIYFKEIEYKNENSKEEITNLLIKNLEEMINISPTQWFIFQPNWIGDDYE